MLDHDDDLWTALGDSHQVGSVRAVARYGSRQQELDVVRAGTVKFSGDAVIQSSTEVTVYGSGRESLVPRARDALLAPFGQEIALWRTVSTRSRAWEIPLGVFRITKASEMRERRWFGHVVDWSVKCTLKDRFEPIEAADFLAVEAPANGATAWAELQRLSPIPVQRSLPDRVVPPATVYESRIEAINVLASILGGVPHLTRQGVLTVRPSDVWATATASQFTISGVVQAVDELTNEFYNQVRVSSTNDANLTGFASLLDESDPRSVQRAGARTYTQSAPFYETQTQVDQAAQTLLYRLLNRRSRKVHIECLPQALLLELGDYGTFEERDAVSDELLRAVTGEVAAIQAPLSPTATVGVDVIVAEGG